MPEKTVGFWGLILNFIKDYIIFPLVNISIIDIIDIILLAILIYWVYKFIRDRHAGRAVLGFGIIMLLYVLSDIFDMVAIKSILENFYAVGIIALCVLFQPELRDVLEEFGANTSMNLKMIKNRRETNDQKILAMVDEVSAAAFELSAKREGALIVIERVGRLHNQLSQGTPIDALVSKELLCNIFVNKSPLHDGAVIIRDCRIVSASNKSKTISENMILVEGLGTRHRAGLKISEISDAVVVIVSEETGTISVANNKLLKRHYNDIGKGGRRKSGDLRDDLFKLMTGKSVSELSVSEDDGESAESLKGIENSRTEVSEENETV